MAALGSQSIASSYEQLLHVDADGGGNGTTHVSVKDGDNGTTFGFTIASDALMMTSTNRLEFGDNGTYIHQSADGVLDLVSDSEIEINATTIDMNGAADLSGDLTLAGDIVFNAAGKGICLGVTSNTDSNTLDDYEEGTFDMAITAGSGTITINTSYNLFTYTKVGRLVTIEGRARISAISSPSGALAMTGLPFTSTGVGEDGSQTAVSFYLRGAASAVNSCIGQISSDATSIVLAENGTTGTGDDMADHIDTGSFIMIGGTYVAT